KDNAPTVQRLVDAGAIILGKTNMHELAFGISGYNEGFYTKAPVGTRNPYDRTRIAGGSSSGTGAAIGGRPGPGGLGRQNSGARPHHRGRVGGGALRAADDWRRVVSAATPAARSGSRRRCRAAPGCGRPSASTVRTASRRS